MGNGRSVSKHEPRECVTCGKSFTPHVVTQVACSRSCRDRQPAAAAKQAAWNALPENRERKNKARRVAVNPSRREANLRANLKRYGLTPEDYDRMMSEQEGCCAICGSPPDPNGVRAQSRLHVDHDHESVRVRGLLCGRCNPGIGYLGHDVQRLRDAIAYLQRT